MADASLARFAGRFVWLELNFDRLENKEFLARHGVSYTPTFLVLNLSAEGEPATATQFGAMTLTEMGSFLDRGARGLTSSTNAPEDAALARGDQLLAIGRAAEAAAAYSEALRLGTKTWPERERAVASFTWAAMTSRQTQSCAEVAASEAPQMSRSGMFGRTVLAGLVCVSDQTAPWAVKPRVILEPLAGEAIQLPTTARDHRFQLYQHLMYSADQRGEKQTVVSLGERWLKELDETKPQNDDERSALDIARVDAASILNDPARVIPALIASERAMPANYNASLRLAQMLSDAKRYDEAIAACDRGLKHVNGPLGRTWLLQIKADAFLGKGNKTAASRILRDALDSAQQIGTKDARERNVDKIMKLMKSVESPPSTR